MSENAAFATGRARRWPWCIGPLIALCLLSSSCSVAQAQSWQCRAPAGGFVDHDIAVPESATEFSGEMIIHKANGLSWWHPTAKVAFTDLDLAASGCHCNGGRGDMVSRISRQFPGFAVGRRQGDPARARAPYDKPVTFKLNFAWDGPLRLEVGNRVVTGMSSIPKRNNLTLSCSTADVDFAVTVAPPPPHTPERCAYAAREQWPAADIDHNCRASRPAE